MKNTKIIAITVSSAFAFGAGAAALGALTDDPAAPTPRSSGPGTQLVSDDGTAKSVYDGAKDAVAYISAASAKGRAPAPGSSSPPTA